MSRTVSPRRAVVLVGQATHDLGTRRHGSLEEGVRLVAHHVDEVVAGDRCPNGESSLPAVPNMIPPPRGQRISACSMIEGSSSRVLVGHRSNQRQWECLARLLDRSRQRAAGGCSVQTSTVEDLDAPS